MTSNPLTPAGATQGVTEQEIAEFLLHTPGFFERHAELLATVQLTHPLGQRAVSLQERQAEMLRDKIKGLEQRIMEMIRNGQENVAIADRLHRWTKRLMQTVQAAELPEVLVQELRHQFMIPQAGLRLWGVDAAFAEAEFAQAVSADVKSFASSLSQPYCGVNSGFEAAAWLRNSEGSSGGATSLALIPLTLAEDGKPGRAFGLLVLGSPDPTRYTAEMGTEFLLRVGDIASAALARLLAASANRAAGGTD
ncbi:DUF484 domain-containing protein [Paucibacter sp. KBW04]|uniref:DUF484 family protein n=1 Tax=Paucibacter sp. KBW04 TaxID=2153361 RepID=UPI000F576110|nr:DUF484 family protein [Paucibacter sp. KBW04]RQO53704.1 DUF484 domain-containing protein [Paucibacter sp. KBW04]